MGVPDRRVKKPRPLDRRSLRAAVRKLCRQDAGLRRIVDLHGPPPLWSRPTGFSTLLRIILEQQVSLASGKAIFERMHTRLGSVTPTTVLLIGAAGLRRIGLTRQKASYCVDLARALEDGRLNLRGVARLDDAAGRTDLMKVKGVGRWTADVYLLMALSRPDVWPVGDIALQTALQHLRGMRTRPTAEHAEKLASRWSPWRAVAARILWHGYLKGTLRTRS